jgi:hypothetical protein
MSLTLRLEAGAAIAVCGVFGLAPLAKAQGTAPPIGGVTGTIALEGTVEKEYAGAHTIIVTAIDGVEHVFHFAKDLLVHGGKGAGNDALPGLREGASVVVHYTVASTIESAEEIDQIGDEGMKVTEGMVTRVDRDRKQITIRFYDGKSETFRLTERAAVDAGRDIDQAAADAPKVVVYYRDEQGRKIAHFFKKTP